MEIEWVDCEGRAICLAPVALGWLPNLEILLSGLQAICEQHGGFEALWESPDRPLALDLAQKILNLHPRLDKPGAYGIPLFLVSETEICRLFFEGGGSLCKLNQLKPLESSGTAEIDEFPPFECENLVDGYLADLTASLSDYKAAREIVFNHSINSVAQISRRLSDIWAGPEARAQRGLKRWFWQEFWNDPENQDLIDESIFGD